MAAITWSHVVDHVPALATIDVDQQSDLLALANGWLNVSLFGGEESPVVKLLRIYLVAHFASPSGTGVTGGGANAAGPVTSESTGGIARSYASASSGGDDGAGFGETVWGRRYLAIVRSAPRVRMPRVA